MVVNSLDPDGTKLAEGVQKAKDEITEYGDSYYDHEKKREYMIITGVEKDMT